MAQTGRRRIDRYVSDYVVFDLETTGVSPKRDRIIEISALKIGDHEVADEFSTLINPERDIPYGATQVNHITDDMVAGAPTIDEVLPQFLKFVGDSVLLGQNIAQFDLKFIDRECAAMGLTTLDNDYADTLPLSRACLCELHHHTLTDLCRHFGIVTEGAHRAMNDCYMTHRVYEKLGPMIEAAVKLVPKCRKCGREMVRRKGKFGEFWGCSGYPDCRYTMNIK